MMTLSLLGPMPVIKTMDKLQQDIVDPAADRLAACLADAGRLISSYRPSDDHGTKSTMGNIINETQKYSSPLNKLADMFISNEYINVQPIRIIQHLSCTGGTLFSRCIAAMPNIVLLSEIYPLSELSFFPNKSPTFCPTDAISLARLGEAPAIDALCEKVFLEEMRAIEKHIRYYGQRLVLREHSHSNYLVGNEITGGKTISEMLKGTSRLLSILTVRHPLDSYLSVRHNGWIHFEPATFDEYCRRYLIFLSRRGDVPIFKYEDLLESPEDVLEQICCHFEIPYNQNFQNYLGIVSTTGNSDRTSNHIGKRTRRPIDSALLLEMQASSSFRELCEALNYEDA